MPRYKCVVEYDGTAFSGWQRQADVSSVQQTLEEAIEAFSGESVRIHTAGRTDAGVHASGQVMHFDLQKEFPTGKVQGALNHYSRPMPVSVLSVVQVDESFHARFSAKRRYYTYRMINRRAPLMLEKHRAWHVPWKLDVEAMRQGAQFLLGNHDFTSFRDTLCQAKSPVKTLDTLTIAQEGELILFHIDALSFLHHMVRIIVGSLEQVGNGRWNPEDIKKALEAVDRTKSGPTAPAYGLYLTKVDYK